MSSVPIPAAEVEITEALVLDLLAEQHPDLLGRPLRWAAHGWDNAMFRLGDDLAVRLPRRQMGAQLIEHEHRWLGALAARLPVPIPAPVRLGRPGAGYPWKWSVVPWFPGDTALARPPTAAEGPALAAQLGAFVRALHTPAPEDAPRNPFRAVSLSARAEIGRQRLAALGGAVDAAAVEATFRHAEAAPEWAHPPVWVHGDLHPGNLVLHQGSFSAIIDFGDLTAGDPATDHAIAWALFDAPDRARYRQAAGAPDDATWRRASGWAVHFALIVLNHTSDHPNTHPIAHQMLRRAAGVMAPTPPKP